jgi:hypothetical protein
LQVFSKYHKLGRKLQKKNLIESQVLNYT